MAFGNIGGGVGGGDGLHFYSPPHIFSGGSLSACRTARDAAFMSGGALADSLADYQADSFLAIILDPKTAGDDVFETYMPGNEGVVYKNNQWRARTDVLRGPPGGDRRSRLIPVYWESEEDIEVDQYGGRQWTQGAASRGAIYLPDSVTVVSIALELSLQPPTDGSIKADETTTVALEFVRGMDRPEDRQNSIISGTSVTIASMPPIVGVRRGSAVVNPTDVEIPAGSWVRPITTAPQSAGFEDSNNKGVFTVWFR